MIEYLKSKRFTYNFQGCQDSSIQVHPALVQRISNKKYDNCSHQGHVGLHETFPADSQILSL